ncbi:uncharacterized protein MONBRDRAFT_18922 [Monosiga brevicollis MX1]|uniref:Methyltransferase type 11 domain-containing protein n=1 Tax=Monosiga brevicollis TaxID=81824 RepID=A9UXF0_MONBE|nr:uncharacterized protein MONBRDRAFT_18922 [Monosiga brevicollis MX1]EDQ89994.1 predicted protein [Monosiga brevicollis MX1]|eukprot:XP_001745416.1 hypothetical protein [Monosiga brevicollis MX1]
MSRPEYAAPPELFYNADEAAKYTQNTRMIQIQRQLTERCLELLNLPAERACFLLDVGCGSGLSGEQLTYGGHIWIGMDISRDMLDVANERGCEGDLFEADMGQGAFYKPGTFDGVISVSALQWLCNQDKRWHEPRKRLKKFFTTLYGCMWPGLSASFPTDLWWLEMITHAAMKAGFTGGVVVDYPHSTRAKKIYLCLFAGVVGNVPRGKTGEEGANQQSAGASFSKQERRDKRKQRATKGRDWIMQKKERRRKQIGQREVRPDTKYTGRKRADKF